MLALSRSFAGAIALSLLLHSCDSSKDLDREKAKEIIKTHFDFPQVYKSSFECGRKSMLSNRLVGPLRELQQAGLITMEQTTWWGHSDIYWRVMLTQEAEKYQVADGAFNPMSSPSANLVSHVVDIREVTGIKFNPEKTEAEVDYVIYVANTTPFGTFAYGNGLENAKKGGPLTAKLTLYDDGWRVANDEANAIHKDVIGGLAQFQHLFLPAEPSNSQEAPSIVSPTQPTPSGAVDMAAISIGSLDWMRTNLNVSRFQNGEKIFHATSSQDWAACKSQRRPAWCWFNNDSVQYGHLGKFYNWYALSDPRGLAPNGWRVATLWDWNNLKQNIGESGGNKIKAKIYWMNSLGQPENNSDMLGFSAFPNSYCNLENTQQSKSFVNGYIAYWWSSTDLQTYKNEFNPSYADAAMVRMLQSDNLSGTSSPKSSGLPVRCVRDKQ